MKNTVDILQKKIRQQIRLKRQQLSQSDQIVAADQVLQSILQHPNIKSAKNIAIFCSVDGELDTKPLIKNLWAQNKKIYLPVLHPFRRHHLLFLHYQPNTPLIKNRFNIAEPELNLANVLPIAQLDILFVPLVAFDKQGQRLGMGGGFYDRLLANWQTKHYYPIGLAHDCQLVDKIPTASWDIPLPEIITPSKRWRW